MKLRLLVLLLTVFAVTVSAQTQLTTLIFVRHAEKVNDGTRDPELSEEGKQRSIRLGQLLAAQKLSAVYSTNFKRTRNTVEHIAKDHDASVTIYESMNAEQLKSLAQQYKGGTVLICGHSNTTPSMINSILGTQTFKQWDDSDYGNLVLVTVTSTGEANVTTLRY